MAMLFSGSGLVTGVTRRSGSVPAVTVANCDQRTCRMCASLSLPLNRKQSGSSTVLLFGVDILRIEKRVGRTDALAIRFGHHRELP